MDVKVLQNIRITRCEGRVTTSRDLTEQEVQHLQNLLTQPSQGNCVCLRLGEVSGLDGETFYHACIRRKDGKKPRNKDVRRIYEESFYLGFMHWDPHKKDFIRACLAAGIEVDQSLVRMIELF